MDMFQLAEAVAVCCFGMISYRAGFNSGSQASISQVHGIARYLAAGIDMGFVFKRVGNVAGFYREGTEEAIDNAELLRGMAQQGKGEQ